MMQIIKLALATALGVVFLWLITEFIRSIFEIILYYKFNKKKED